MLQMWEFIKYNYQLYNTGGMYMALFFCGLLFLFIYKKKEEPVILFLYPSILLFLIIFNPVTAKVLTKFMSGEEVYWRSFWLLPIPFVLAYVPVKLTEQQSERRMKLMVLTACTVIIIMSGRFVYTKENYSKIDNPYKIPTEVIQVCDIIEEDIKEHHTKNLTPRVIVPWEMVMTVRQYDANIEMLYGRWGGPVQALRDEMYNGSPDIEKVVDYARVYSCEYIVFNVTVNYNPEQNPLSYGLELAGSTETYRIFRDTKFGESVMSLSELEEKYADSE